MLVDKMPQIPERLSLPGLPALKYQRKPFSPIRVVFATLAASALAGGLIWGLQVAGRHTGWFVSLLALALAGLNVLVYRGQQSMVEEYEDEYSDWLATKERREATVGDYTQNGRNTWFPALAHYKTEEGVRITFLNGGQPNMVTLPPEDIRYWYGPHRAVRFSNLSYGGEGELNWGACAVIYDPEQPDAAPRFTEEVLGEVRRISNLAPISESGA